jgi:hypothetical protein
VVQHISASGVSVVYIPETSNYRFETKMAVAIGKAGFSVMVEDAHTMICGCVADLNMTRCELRVVPLETRLTGVDDMPNGGGTMVGFSLNLGDREPSKYIIDLPAAHINGVLYRVLPIELELRMFDVGIEPFTC